MEQQLLSPDHIRLLRLKLSGDAERASSESSEECSQEWVDPLLWSQYMGKAGRMLYTSFSDEELLDILRHAADKLGHAPSQKEIFCVYRAYIRRRFNNWPMALRAAGLKAPKKKRRNHDDQ
jgi:disulfide oxidoreductase YuzD